MVMTYIHAHTKFQVNGQLVQQIEWKQTDGRTDGRMDGTDCIRPTHPANVVGNEEGAFITSIAPYTTSVCESRLVR